MHLTVSIFGDNAFFEKFGKAGTNNDILIRNQSDSGHVVTYVAPNSDRIQPVLQCMAMSDFHVVVVNDITPAVGEVLVALDAIGVKNGVIVSDYLEDKVRTIIKGMSIENFSFVKKDENAVREKVLSFVPERTVNPSIITIDNYFPVKGVGTVVLGMVKSGKIRQYDKMMCYPIKKEVTIKSMQSQDRDVKETEPGQRIGLALKDMEVDDLKRGYIFCDKEMPCTREIKIDLVKSKFSKFELAKGRKLMASIGLQVVTGEITDVSDTVVTILLESSMAVYQDSCLLVTTDSMPRIIGRGRII